MSLGESWIVSFVLIVPLILLLIYVRRNRKRADEHLGFLAEGLGLFAQVLGWLALLGVFAFVALAVLIWAWRTVFGTR
jgi:hypothetical protein